jgi:hypothetical protein
MNTAFQKPFGRLGGKVSVWFGLALFPLMAMGTDSLYTSPASVTTPPNVDATNFFNNGTWNISTYPQPFATKSTLNYTNRGTMTGSVGWQFDFGSGSGGRTWSANFLNDNGATITALDTTVGIGLSWGTLISQRSYLWVSATNIVNKGLLNAGAGGEIVLTGSSINLSHSGGLQIYPVGGTGSANGETNFIPDTAIYDEYWEATNGNLTVYGSPWDGTTLGGFTGFVAEPCGAIAQIGIGPFIPTVVDSITNALNPFVLMTTNSGGGAVNYQVYSNLYFQGVFVYTGTNNVAAQIRFLPTGNPSNGFAIVSVQVASVLTNVVTAQGQTNAFYFVDAFAASTNHGLNFSLVNNPASPCSFYPTFRPAAYTVSRTVPFEYAVGFSPGLGVPPPTFFYIPPNGTAPYFTNLLVRGGDSAAYSCLLDNVAAQVLPGRSVTNLPGRVRIYADNLNLNQAHVRAEGQIIIQATNLITSANAILDCQNLSYNLGSTSGSLNFTNLARSSVSRLHGTCDMVTAVWSNLLVTVYQNYTASNPPSGPPVYTESDITNITLVNLSLTAVDASGLQTSVPVTVQNLALHSPQMVVSDSVVADETFLLDGLNANLVGNVTFSGALQNWTQANAPTLLYFTNNGVLSIPNTAHFGDDRPAGYLSFVNNGTISAGGQFINSVNLQINSPGAIYCNSGGFVGVAQSVLLTGAIIQSQSDIQFFANNLQLTELTTLNAIGVTSGGGALNLTVTNILGDGGAASGNAINCRNGFNLWRKPAKGDLLGTAVNSYAPLNNQIDQFWAGADRGRSLAGFQNNVALGSLALIPESGQISGYEPLFAFHGTTPTVGLYGLYVSNLNLSSLLDYYNEIAIDPSITIYYENAFLNGTNASQFLDNVQFPDANGNPGGYMRWVQNGPAANSMPVSYGKMTGSYNTPNGHFQIQVTSGAGTASFVIQASADLKNWAPVYTNNGPFGVYTDPNAGGYPHRFYRTAPLP